MLCMQSTYQKHVYKGRDSESDTRPSKWSEASTRSQQSVVSALGLNLEAWITYQPSVNFRENGGKIYPYVFEHTTTMEREIGSLALWILYTIKEMEYMRLKCMLCMMMVEVIHAQFTQPTRNEYPMWIIKGM